MKKHKQRRDFMRVDRLLYWHLPVEQRIIILANLVLDQMEKSEAEEHTIAQEVSTNV